MQETRRWLLSSAIRSILSGSPRRFQGRQLTSRVPIGLLHPEVLVLYFLPSFSLPGVVRLDASFGYIIRFTFMEPLLLLFPSSPFSPLSKLLLPSWHREVYLSKRFPSFLMCSSPFSYFWRESPSDGPYSCLAYLPSLHSLFLLVLTAS